MVDTTAKLVHGMMACSLLDELGVRYPSGQVYDWLAPTPPHLLAEVARVVEFPEGCTEELAEDMAHWLMGSGGASGHHEEPAGFPDWSCDGEYTLGDDGVVYLGGVKLGSVEEVTGIEWFAPEDFASLRECLLEIWPVGDEAETPGPQDVMTSRGYAELWPDGDVVQHGVIQMRVTLPDWP